MTRRLYRCRENRVLAGVAAGVAEFFDLDPTLVRVLWFLSIFVGGLGILLYIGLALIVPLEPSSADAALRDPLAPDGHRHVTGVVEHRHSERGGGRVTIVLGVALVAFGLIALVDQVVPGWAQSVRYLWPLVVVGLGALLVVGSLRRESTE